MLTAVDGSGSLAAFDYYDTPNKTDYAGVAQPADFRLRRISYQTLGAVLRQQHDYRYDRAGNVTKWWQQDEQGVLHDWTLGYDDLDRLTSAAATNAPSGQPASFAYAYDALGRITSGPLGTYSYGDAGHEHAATAAGSNTYSYDANGALLVRIESGTGYSHSYDLLGQLSSVVVGGATNHALYYDGDGQLIARRISDYPVRHYAAGGLYDRDMTTGAITKLYRFGGRLVAIRGAALHYIGQDHLGSLTLQMTANEVVEGAQLRAPYGAPWYATGTLATERAYTDQRSLEATLGSLYHYGARTYSPVLGRFASPDPLIVPADPRSLDAYAYARNNPLRFSDPTGMAAATGNETGGGCDPSGCPAPPPDDQSANPNPTTASNAGGTSNPFTSTPPQSGATALPQPAQQPAPPINVTPGGPIVLPALPGFGPPTPSSSPPGFTPTQPASIVTTATQKGEKPTSATPAPTATPESAPTPELRPDVKVSGGRSGQRVKDAEGLPPNSVVRGSEGRVYLTDENGRIIRDITKERAKEVTPGRGFGPKEQPTSQELGWIKVLWPE